MVFGFVSDASGASFLIFMGQHEEENDRLLKMGCSEDVWFHVEHFSSAHVYLRMPRGMTIDMVPEEILEDCCQLVKKNSIRGSKMDAVTVVYTKKDNLRKTKGMAVGQVGFEKEHLLRRRKAERTAETNGIVRRLEKTKWKEKTTR